MRTYVCFLMLCRLGRAAGYIRTYTHIHTRLGCFGNGMSPDAYLCGCRMYSCLFITWFVIRIRNTNTGSK